ncbi:MAG: hypothetical protein ACTHM8_11380 [Sphingomonas sp.]
MRILLCLLPFAAIASAPVSDRLPAGDVGKCPDVKITDAKRDKPVTVHPLNQEPGAKQEIAVLHYDANHCVKPIVVRDDVSGKAN